ncbi:MAG: hypothetical protein AMXMBFR53_23080 [Gemmatimonadota bacterium]
MTRDPALTATSLAPIALLTLHLAGDVVFGMEEGGPEMLVGVLILAVWLYATVALPRRLPGYVILFLGSVLGAAMPVIHTRGAGLGGAFAARPGAFFFIWTLLALGVLGLVAAALSVRGIWSLRRPATPFEPPPR